MSEANVTTTHGDPWKNEHFFQTFEEADDLRRSLKAHDKTGALQVKIKRCGNGKTMYVVKSRTDPNLKAALEEIEEKMLRKKSDKKSKK